MRQASSGAPLEAAFDRQVRKATIAKSFPGCTSRGSMASLVRTVSRESPFKHLGLKAGILRNYLYDVGRFIRTSFVTEAREREHQRALIYILSHSIEHGMSLSDPRVGFGFAKVATLLAETRSYGAAYGLDDTAAMALKVLDAYVAFNAGAGADIGDLSQTLTDLDDQFAFRWEEVEGGTENELVITMIGAGHLKDHFKVPRSQRKRPVEVLHLDPPLHV
jgi:hypothetical protein